MSATDFVFFAISVGVRGHSFTSSRESQLNHRVGSPGDSLCIHNRDVSNAPQITFHVNRFNRLYYVGSMMSFANHEIADVLLSLYALNVLKSTMLEDR